jgi:hypothetical protein
MVVKTRDLQHRGARAATRRALRLLAVGCIAAGAVALAQTPDTFTAYLDWVPISGAERNDVAGAGSATATLSRSQLTITGCFGGLPAAATRATLHQGVATGARGPAIADLAITKSADGTLSGGAELNREQRDALLAGHLYIQLHSERGVAPDGATLWGWLLTNQKPAANRCAMR